jgi:serine/threonine-protein kinase RsbW
MTLSLELVSAPESITKVEPLLQRLAKRVPISTETYSNILLALTEAVNNAILHGNKSDHSKKVLVHTYYSHETIVFEVSDEGSGFDAELVPDPTLPENIEIPGGRGVFLMQNLCDNLLYTDKGRTARLTFFTLSRVPVS